MAKEKQTKSRIIHKHDIEANWNKAVNFIPDKGETIVYDIDDNYSYERIKMGDGETTVIALPFITDNIPQPDWNASEGEAGYVKNRTHWVEGNRTVVNWNESLTAISNGSGTYYRVSTLTPTKEEIIGGTFVKSDGTTFAIDSSLISKTTYWLEISMGAIYVVYGKENQSITFNGLIFPGCGIYFTKNAYKQIVSMTWGEEVVHKLDKKFLPDDIGVGADWSQNNETAPDYVKNRTHYEETTVVNEPLNITWDGNTEGLVSVDVEVFKDEFAESVSGFYKVSDIVLNDEQIKSCVINAVEINNNGTFNKSDVLENSWQEIVDEGGVTDAFVRCGFAIFVKKPTNEYKESGIYFLKETTNGTNPITGSPMNNTNTCVALTTTEPVPQTKTVVKKLDIKYIPDEIARVATMETITPEMIIEMMDEVGAAQPIADADNAVLTTDDNKILIL